MPRASDDHFKGLRAARGDVAGEQLLVVTYPLEDEGDSDLPELTVALRDVARMLALGYAPRTIAARRGTSPATIARQITHIYKRLAVGTRGELVALILNRCRR